MEQKKKIIAAVLVLGVVLLVGSVMLKSSYTPELSGTYVAESRGYLLPDKLVFENGYCDIKGVTLTYEYKNGTIYFFWGNAVWGKYKCTINGNTLVLDNGEASVTYRKQ